jgi:hypothetical protein
MHGPTNVKTVPPKNWEKKKKKIETVKQVSFQVGVNICCIYIALIHSNRAYFLPIASNLTSNVMHRRVIFWIGMSWKENGVGNMGYYEVLFQDLFIESEKNS